MNEELKQAFDENAELLRRCYAEATKMVGVEAIPGAISDLALVLFKSCVAGDGRNAALEILGEIAGRYIGYLEEMERNKPVMPFFSTSPDEVKKPCTHRRLELLYLMWFRVSTVLGNGEWQTQAEEYVYLCAMSGVSTIMPSDDYKRDTSISCPQCGKPFTLEEFYSGSIWAEEE